MLWMNLNVVDIIHLKVTTLLWAHEDQGYSTEESLDYGRMEISLAHSSGEV